MSAREIVFYATVAGRQPVRDFLDSLSPKDAQRVTWVLGLVEELSIVPSQYFKKLQDTNGLWKVRAQCRSNAYRLLGFWDGPGFVVLCHALAKKTQRLPRGALRTAQERRVDYLRRKAVR